MSKKEKKNRGITLITLIITVMVLSILAVVSFSVLINSKVLDGTDEAKFKANMADHREKVNTYTSKILVDNLDFDSTYINAGKVLESAIRDEIITDITVADVNLKLKDIIPTISDEEKDYIVVYEGEMYYVSDSTMENNEKYEKWCREINIPILTYEKPKGIDNINGSYQEVNDLYVCTPNLIDGFDSEIIRYLEVGDNGKLYPRKLANI